MTPEQTIMDAQPQPHTTTPQIERPLEIGDRVEHSKYGAGVVITIVPNAFDPKMETYVGVRFDNDVNARVPVSQLKWLASNAEPLPFGPEYDAPKFIVITREPEPTAEGEAPHGVGAGAAKPQPLPKRPATKKPASISTRKGKPAVAKPKARPHANKPAAKRR